MRFAEISGKKSCTQKLSDIQFSKRSDVPGRGVIPQKFGGNLGGTLPKSLTAFMTVSADTAALNMFF